MDRKEIADTISDMMGQGKTGLKQGYTDEYANNLLQQAKEMARADYEAQKDAGYAEFSRQRANLRYDEWIDKNPDSPRERNQQLRYLKTILRDPSSTVEGAEEIRVNLSDLYGQELTKTQTVNLLNIMGKAERRGIRVSQQTISSNEYRKVFEELPTDKLSPDEIEKMVDDFEKDYRETTGIPNLRDRQNTPKKAKVKRVNPKETVITQNRETQSVHKPSKIRSGSNRKFSESSARKHGRKSPKKY